MTLFTRYFLKVFHHNPSTFNLARCGIYQAVATGPRRVTQARKESAGFEPASAPFHGEKIGRHPNAFQKRRLQAQKCQLEIFYDVYFFCSQCKQGESNSSAKPKKCVHRFSYDIDNLRCLLLARGENLEYILGVPTIIEYVTVSLSDDIILTPIFKKCLRIYTAKTPQTCHFSPLNNQNAITVTMSKCQKSIA